MGQPTRSSHENLWSPNPSPSSWKLRTLDSTNPRVSNKHFNTSFVSSSGGFFGRIRQFDVEHQVRFGTFTGMPSIFINQGHKRLVLTTPIPPTVGFHRFRPRPISCATHFKVLAPHVGGPGPKEFSGSTPLKGRVNSTPLKQHRKTPANVYPMQGSLGC